MRINIQPGRYRVGAFVFSVTCICSQTHAINKCELNGKLIYTDQPCPDGATSLPYDQHVDPPSDPAGARQRSLNDKKNLQQLEQQRSKQDKQMQRDARAFARQQKAEQEKESKCRDLDLKRQLANQDLAKARVAGKSGQFKKSQLKSQVAENNYAKICKDN